MIGVMYDKFDNLEDHVKLFSLFVLLNLLDFQTTKFIIDHEGFVGEGNPILYHAMVMTNSVYAILWIKVLVLGWFCSLLPHINHQHTGLQNATVVKRVITILCVVFALIVCWNSYRVGEVAAAYGVF